MFSSPSHAEKYEMYNNNSKFSTSEWLEYTKSLRKNDVKTANLESIVDDFMTYPVRPQINPSRASGNAEYDYENLISSNGARIYTNKEQYTKAMSK